MKRLNIKKLAAIGLGAALVGSAIAPAFAAVDLTKGDLYSATTGAPTVNLVVGAQANVSDGIWAANLASKIAAKATTTETITPVVTAEATAETQVTDLAAKLTVGGVVTTVVAGAKTIKADLNTAGLDYDTTATAGPNVTTPSTPYNGTTITSSSLSNLVNKSYNEKINSTTNSLTIKEEIILDTDNSPKFDNQATVGNLVLEIPAGNDARSSGFIYRINLGSGLAGLDTNFTDTGTDDAVKMPFWGKDYTVRSISSSQIELIQEQSELTYDVGSGSNVITGLAGRGTQAGKTLTATFVQGATDNTVKARLAGEDGTQIDEKWIAAGDAMQDKFVDSAGNAVLDTGVYANTVKNVGSSATPIYTVTALVGAGRLLLVDNKGYPYDPLQTTGFDWRVNLEFDTSTTPKLTGVAIYNSNLTKTGTSALKAGGIFELPEKYAWLEFLGWETGKETSTMTLGTEDSRDTAHLGKVLTFTDKDNYANKLPFYMTASKDSDVGVVFNGNNICARVVTNPTGEDQNFVITSGNPVNGYTWNFDTNTSGLRNFRTGSADTNSGVAITKGSTFDVNNVTYTLRDVNYFGTSVMSIIVTPVGGYMTLVDGSSCFNRSDWMSNHSIAADGDGFIFNSTTTKTAYDTNAEGVLFYDNRKVFTGRYLVSNTSATIDTPIEFPSGDSARTTFNYVPYVDESKSNVYFMMAAQSKSGTNQVLQGKGWAFYGTDLDDALFNTSTVVTRDVNYFLPDTTDFENHQFPGSTTDNNFFTAVFGFDDTETPTWDTNAFINTATGLGTHYDPQRTAPTVEVSHGSTSSTWNLRDDDTTNYIGMAYTDFGSKFNIASNVMTFLSPDTRPEVVVYIKSEGSTTATTSTGETITIVEGQSGTTTAGSTVTVDDITYTAAPSTAACAAEDITVTKAVSPNDVKVYSDAETVPGTVIVIGGWKVNSYATGLGLEDLLTKTTDKVAKKIGEKIVIAGFTKNDTAAAVQEVINWLDTQ